MQTVADTSALIYTAKNQEFTQILKKIFQNIYIPPSVHQESIIKGKELGKQDALILEKMIEEDFLILKPLNKYGKEIKEKIQKTKGLGNGEIEAISLAKQMNIEKILIDDQLASKTAKALGLKPIPITYILILATRKGIINLKEGLKILHQTINEGYHLSAEDYIAIKNKMEKTQ